MTNKRWQRRLILVLFLLGVSLHMGRLAWQPLWADEGYSLYFGTEPLPRMLWLTARDIHPPLYYALLHFWISINGTGPTFLRLFSNAMALPAMALTPMLAAMLFPQRPRLPVVALLLLIANPMYLFYSQEVRMYGLALSLTLAGTYCFWQAFVVAQPGNPRWWIAYVVTASAALYTLYYTAFLLLAHACWALWHNRYNRRRIQHFLWAEMLIALLYLPWLIYTVSSLATYIEQKIGADQDRPLNLAVYLARHLLAFLAGHLTLPTWPPFWRWSAVVALLLLLLPLLWAWWQPTIARSHRPPDATGTIYATDAVHALWWFLLLPTAIAFLVNRFFPFFPDGGERLLLFVLPYALLLIALAIDLNWAGWHLGKIALVIFLLCAGAGVATFYTLPRYGNDDYRPLVRQVVQQGRDEDTLLATFPWQVGLWRAYAPLAGLSNPTQYGPHVTLVSERTVVWGAAVEELIDGALARGTLWFPGLRSIGSTFPDEVNAFLADRPAADQPVLLADHWYGNTTLRAWRQLAAGSPVVHAVAFEQHSLAAVAITPATITAANLPIRVDLQWADLPTDPAVGMTLRLEHAGSVWTNRDLAAITGTVGLIVPVGLPPGRYDLLLGLVDEHEQLLPLAGTDRSKNNLASIGAVTVTVPAETPLAARLPIRFPLPTPVIADGIALLGHSVGAQIPLAGEPLTVSLFWQSVVEGPPDRHLYVSLLDHQGNGVAGWEGWPLPDYPTTTWAAAALVQTPVTFALPPTLATGRYQLGAGLLDPKTGVKSPITILGEQAVQQRPINYDQSSRHSRYPNQFNLAPMCCCGVMSYSATQNS
ncbi:MAG: glycosyltransferase family 39 protein [Caldilineaceae bacterium]